MPPHANSTRWHLRFSLYTLPLSPRLHAIETEIPIMNLFSREMLMLSAIARLRNYLHHTIPHPGSDKYPEPPLQF